MRWRWSVGISRSAALPTGGPETSEQFDILRSLGVDFAQGYLLGRPAPLAELDAQPHFRPRRDAA